MTHAFSFTAGGGSNAIYLEAAAGVTTFVLAGRWFEARATRRAGAALRALLDRFPGLTAATELPVDRRRSVLVNAWRALPVRLVAEDA